MTERSVFRFFFPEFMLGAELIQARVRTITALADLASLQCCDDGAAWLAQMGAVMEAAGPEIWQKVDEIGVKGNLAFVADPFGKDSRAGERPV